MCTVLLQPGVYPIAVNKYIIIQKQVTVRQAEETIDNQNRRKLTGIKTERKCQNKHALLKFPNVFRSLFTNKSALDIKKPKSACFPCILGRSLY
jgi:hypothetical protein